MKKATPQSCFLWCQHIEDITFSCFFVIYLRNLGVIITEYHGEEFMEKGRWGHSSLCPLDTGTGGSVRSRMTSHFDIPVDIPATIMPFLDVMPPAGEYSLENNFF